MLNIIPADDLTEVADIEDEELCQVQKTQAQFDLLSFHCCES
jgi:hypothetical protein